MQLAIKKWGNSVGIRIPSTILKTLNLEPEYLVDISVENGRIIIEPINRTYSLNQLLAEITPENLHEEIITGATVGKEVL